MQDVTKDRSKYIGGSDIPIILGISPFKTRFDLLLEKAELKENDFKGNEYTEYGNIMEFKIREYVGETLGTHFSEGKHIDGDIRCHTDGENASSILEIKTTSEIHQGVNEYKVYLVQLLFYMEHVKRDTGILAVYNRPDDFNEEFDESRLQLFTISIDNYKELLEQINKAVDQFRIDLEKIKENPFMTEEELLPTDVTEQANKVMALEIEVANMKKAETKLKEAKVQLKKAMEDKGIKKWETPNGTKFTLVADGEDKEIQVFNENKFKEENESIYKKYLETKIQKGKSGYVKITLPKEA